METDTNGYFLLSILIRFYLSGGIFTEIIWAINNDCRAIYCVRFTLKQLSPRTRTGPAKLKLLDYPNASIRIRVSPYSKR